MAEGVRGFHRLLTDPPIQFGETKSGGLVSIVRVQNLVQFA